MQAEHRVVHVVGFEHVLDGSVVVGQFMLFDSDYCQHVSWDCRLFRSKYITWTIVAGNSFKSNRITIVYNCTNCWAYLFCIDTDICSYRYVYQCKKLEFSGKIRTPVATLSCASLPSIVIPGFLFNSAGLRL